MGLSFSLPEIGVYNEVVTPKDANVDQAFLGLKVIKSTPRFVSDSEVCGSNALHTVVNVKWLNPFALVQG